MQGLIQRTWTPESRLHIGDLAWQRNAVPGRGPTWRTSFWEEEGELVAWGWAELPDHLSLVVDPARPELAAEVLDWFRRVAGADRLSCAVLETEPHLVSALEEAGYRPDDQAPFFTHHDLSLDNLEPASVPAGFTVRHVRPDEVDRRAAGHRAAWSDWGPSKVSVESMGAVMSSWPYRHDLDWVVEGPDGDFVATALVWLDDVHGVGLVEPVGCAPAYRRQGLARAVNLAALLALRDLGATRARVCPRGDDGYPVARKLYQNLGFRPGHRTVTFVA
ncbi:MAG TPA: GNAT family N-acetyltransferase [Kribbella sp.]|nr:GNAT family N-acetyltransferase [Kribbella sp.]